MKGPIVTVVEARSNTSIVTDFDALQKVELYRGKRWAAGAAIGCSIDGSSVGVTQKRPTTG